MKISYNKDVKIAGIGMVPWTRLGPERWFPDYKIASMEGWDITDTDAPTVIAADGPLLVKANTQNLIEDQGFQAKLLQTLPGYDFMTYKPVVVPSELAAHRFLKNDEKLAQRLENKAAFREDMKSFNLPFPAYTIKKRAALSGANIETVLAGRSKVILQDELLSGGKGTHVVSDVASFEKALRDIESNNGGTHVVISDFVTNFSERSLQCCVTQYGIFIGPMQTQIVGDELLANLSVPDGDRYCGAQISPNDRHLDKYDEMKRIAQSIGEHIQSLGYKGIYGIDFLIAENGTVYVLEINPRITGATPLVTALYREGQDIPFYLLHILELSGQPYEITDMSVNSSPAEGSLFILHSQRPRAAILQQTITSGFYNPDTVEFQKSAIRLDIKNADEQLLLQQYMPKGSVVKLGGRIVKGYTNKRILDLQTDQLTDAFRSQVLKIASAVDQ